MCTSKSGVNLTLYSVTIFLQFLLPKSTQTYRYSGTSLLRGSTFADSELRGSKKYSKIKNIKKYEKNIKKLESTFKDELQKTGFKA